LVVKYLLDNGANEDLEDSQGRRAVEYAIEALRLIKLDKCINFDIKLLSFLDKRKVLDESKATKNEYFITSNFFSCNIIKLILIESKKKEFYPDLPARIEKTYQLYL